MHAKRVAILINERGAQASANIQQAKAKASKTAKFIRDTYVGGSGSVMYFGGQRRRQRFRSSLGPYLQLLMQQVAKISELSRGVEKSNLKKKGKEGGS